MTRYELEKWCEKFLQEILDSAKPYTDLMVKAVREDWNEDQLADELAKMFGEQMTPNYNDRSKQLADFIEQFAKEISPKPKGGTAITIKPSDMDSNEFDELADELVEKKYQLRIEHNHSDMKWYAYYAGKSQRLLFDDDADWSTASNTPTEALKKLDQPQPKKPTPQDPVSYKEGF